MLHYKKIAVVAVLSTLTGIGILAMRPADDPPKRNLKVLPKNISNEDLDKVMDGFKAALGVKCNFCHAPSADTSNHHLDFASDAKPEKNIARHMFRMTAKINKKYFSFNKDANGAVIPMISCVTCHRGSPHPDEAKQIMK
ncbi:MAG TPA: c-type cytochrome [Puia sp.]|nr:c-type cytochrome [Puia sp.]